MTSLRRVIIGSSTASRLLRPARTIRPLELLPSQRIAQRTSRRCASSGHGPQKSSSDLPWAIVATLITIPGTWYFLQPSAGAHHEPSHSEEHEEQPDQEDAGGDDKEEKSRDQEKSKGGDDKKPAPKYEESEADDTKAKDSATTKKDAGDSDTMKDKQAGLSNTDTKHPSNHEGSKDQSKKGEGVAESSKVQGTVKTDRPQPENEKK